MGHSLPGNETHLRGQNAICYLSVSLYQINKTCCGLNDTVKVIVVCFKAVELLFYLVIQAQVILAVAFVQKASIQNKILSRNEKERKTLEFFLNGLYLFSLS